jgi:hypothetical protein
VQLLPAKFILRVYVDNLMLKERMYKKKPRIKQPDFFVERNGPLFLREELLIWITGMLAEFNFTHCSMIPAGKKF